jgi:DNA-directed RNA polymerase subunit RPC12/RpoP
MMADHVPTVRYTGTESCVKCGAAAGQIAVGYDSTNDWLELACQRCSYRWIVWPLDGAS